MRLVGKLEHLRAIAPKDKKELRDWYDVARAVEPLLTSSKDLAGRVPEFLWHYLADADIRLKSEPYRNLQDRKLTLLLQYLKRGEVPTEEEISKYYSSR